MEDDCRLDSFVSDEVRWDFEQRFQVMFGCPRGAYPIEGDPIQTPHWWVPRKKPSAPDSPKKPSVFDSVKKFPGVSEAAEWPYTITSEDLPGGGLA